MKEQGVVQKAASSRSSGKNGAPTRSNKGGGSKAKNPKGRNAKAAAAASEPSFLDDSSKRTIVGVVVCIVAFTIFAISCGPTDGIATAFLSKFFHLVFGVGAYVLPVFLIGYAVSFFVKSVRRSARMAVGLLLVFVAFLGLLAAFAPGVSEGSTDHLFDEVVLASLGGYIGSGIAWAGVTLFGQIVTCIVLIGIIVVGIVVTGFSPRAIMDALDERRARREEAEFEKSVRPADPYAARARTTAVQPELPLDDADRSAPTRMIGERAAAHAAKREARPAVDDEARTRALAATSEDGAKEPSTQLTRKLGRTRSEKGDASRARTAKAATPVATPHPQDGFTLPPTSLLATSNVTPAQAADDAELKETAAELQETLEDFGIMAQVVGWVAGPTVTLFKVDLPAGVRVSRVTALNDDIALALAAPGVRIFAPIPGTNYVGIEVPNRQRQTVYLGDVLKDAGEGPLQIAIGKDVEGNSIVTDLAKMPHLLIGGTTGSGKSVSINGMIMSILMRATPSEVRFIMIDPKRVEFTPYNGIPHLYVPVVTEPKEAASALSWGVAEMERRLKVFSRVGARNIGQYNAKAQAETARIAEAEKNGEEPPAREVGEELPYIVIIIDELADLMMNVGKEVEFSISRIAQLARAAGIHLIVATQRPSTNVVTGLIKANITNRIAFNVASGIDSRVILDTPGAENLIGLGDLLFSKPEFAKPLRIQGCYVSEDEINAVVDMLKEQGEPDYHGEILTTNLVTVGTQDVMGSGGSGADDPLIWEAAEIVVSTGLGSTSNIQRRLKVGYSRAGRIMDMLEEKGVVGPPNGSKPREVLVDAMELETLKAFESQDGESV